MSQYIDISDFEGKMGKLKNILPAMSERILMKTAYQVKKDADEIPPKTPHLEGNLRGNVIIEPIGQNGEVVQIHYTMPYGARWHEALFDIDPVTGKKITWSETGVGPKFLEKKLVDYAKKYGQLQAEFFKEELKNAG